MNLPPRQGEVGGLRSLDLYLDEPGRQGARWEGGIAVIDATFNILYDYDLDLGWCVYSLDTTKDNDISHAEGSYQVYAREGGSRLVYRSVAATGGLTPNWVRRKLAFSSARDMLQGMRTRAEAR